MGSTLNKHKSKVKCTTLSVKNALVRDPAKPKEFQAEKSIKENYTIDNSTSEIKASAKKMDSLTLSTPSFIIKHRTFIELTAGSRCDITPILFNGNPEEPEGPSKKRRIQDRVNNANNTSARVTSDFAIKSSEHQTVSEVSLDSQCNAVPVELNGRNENQQITPERHKCVFCTKAVCSYEKLVHHIYSHTGEKVFFCKQCGKEFSLSITLKVHQETCHRKKPVCTIKNQCLSINQKLETKSENNTPASRNQKQNLATKLFKTPRLPRKEQKHKKILPVSKLRYVPVTINGLKRFKCSKCVKVFTHCSNALRHFRDIHLTKVKQSYPCPICCKTFTDRSNLQRHRKRHNLETLMNPEASQHNQAKSSEISVKTNAIENSSETFTPGQSVIENLSTSKITFKSENSTDLQNAQAAILPVRVNTAKCFQCKICSKVYPSNQSIVQHLKTVHKAKRSFRKCNICHEGFDSWSVLHEHKKNVHGCKLFKCTYCPKTFTHSNNMYKHRSSHKELNVEKPKILCNSKKLRHMSYRDTFKKE